MAYPEPSAGRRQGRGRRLELGPDRLRVALAADEEPSRLVDTRCPVGLEALPYVLGVASEHQGVQELLRQRGRRALAARPARERFAAPNPAVLPGRPARSRVGLPLPLIGRVLTRVGSRVEATRPRAGRTLTGIGQTLRAGRRQRRSAR